jgi:putative transposase
MVDTTNQDCHARGMSTWRAGCGGSRTSGSEGGPRKPTGRKAGRAPRSDPYTEHPTLEGKVYCAAVIDAYSRLIVGWSIAEHMRTELVTDALGMAIIRRQPEKRADDARTILHSDHGSQYTSWAFGQRLQKAGLLASMGTVGDCYDNAMMESFWSTMQLELLDSRTWQTREELANAIFEWIECWYNPKRRHSSIGMHSPITFETLHTGPDQDH